MEADILFASQRGQTPEREAILIVGKGYSRLKLKIQEMYIKDLFNEFNVNNVYQLVGKKAVLDLDTGWIYRKQNFMSICRRSTPATFTYSIVIVDR